MQSSVVETPGLRMHYRQQGTGEPVVFIHGFPETSYEWRHQMPALADASLACFAPDTRGYGETEKPGTRASRALLAKDIAAFMDALGLERAAIVGHDWGGIIAFKFAIDFPQRVSRLALLDTLCTVWSPAGVHGYWFKAEGLAEELFANQHAQFIESIFAGGSDPPLPGRPASPWQTAGRGGTRWATDDDVDHYRRAFADPASHASAISYYRYALPFHRVIEDASAPSGERYQSLSERDVASMWLHPEGLEQHPWYPDFMDYGPEDRFRTYDGPTLWMFGRYLARGRGTDTPPDEPNRVPTGNPFVDQFSRYFPDLRVQRVDAGHFFPEEAPEVTNEALLRFLR